VAYWYQSEPHAPFPVLPPVEERLPFALESKDGLRPAEWIGDSSEGFDLFRERNTGMIIAAPRLIHSLTPWYDQAGHRYPLIMTDGAAAGDHVQLHIPVEIGEHYDIDLHYLKGPEMGSAEIMNTRIDGTAEARSIAGLTLEDVRLRDGENLIKLRMLGRESGDEAAELGLVGIHLTPSRRRFITGWRVIGPFDAPDMSFLQKVYPPEREIDPEGSYPGKDGRTVEWTRIQTDTSGWVRLEDIIQPREKAVAYGLAYVHSPSERPAVMRIGSDDGVRIWLNRELVHTHPAYRGAYPDQDTVPVHLRKGWNRLLIKVLQGAGGWGYYVRFVDPEAELTYAVEPTEK